MMSRTALVFFAILLLIAGFFGGILLNRWTPTVSVPSTTTVTVASVISETPVLTDRPESVSIKTAAKRVTPTVVYIESSVDIRKAHEGANPSDPEFWRRFVPGQRISTSGSGVIISTDGFILTNHHVVEGSEGGVVFVELADRRRARGIIVGSDPSTDLAVVKITEPGLTAATLGNSDKVEVGDWVLAVGNPFRLRSTVTAGIVSALGRDVEVINDRLRIEHFIQTDAAINRGNSGGALVDLNGNVVGINTAIASESGSYEGYGFAIPINMALKIARDIMEFGQVKRGLLGVQIATVSYERALELGLPATGGVEIMSLVEEGTALKAGLKSGDVVLSVDAKPVFAANELQALLALYRPGNTVKLAIWRGGKRLELPVPLMDAADIAEVPDEEATPEPDFEQEPVSFKTGLGFSVTEMLSGNSSTLQLIVTSVEENSEAWAKGIRADDKLQTLNGYRMTAIFEVDAAVRNAKRGEVFRLELEKADGAKAYYILRKP